MKILVLGAYGVFGKRLCELLVGLVRGATLWGLRLPRMLLPSGNSYEYESEGSFHFHVEICLPLVGLVVRYEGWLKPVP